MENLWGTIAKARGVEINEEFMLVHKGCKYKHKITTCGLHVFIHGGWYWSSSTDEFIRGKGVIEKIPFRPQVGDSYYTIVQKGVVVANTWEDWSIDYARLIAGVVFRTREEAEAYTQTWKEIISKL